MIAEAPPQKPVYLPRYIIHLWELFGHPPMVWDKIGTYLALQRSLSTDQLAPEPPKPEPIQEEKRVVKTLQEWNRNTICRPDESQLERLGKF